MNNKYIILILLIVSLLTAGLLAADNKDTPADDKGTKKKKTITPYESLRVPVIPPEGMKYGLQTGLYLTKNALQHQQALLKKNKYITQVIEVQDDRQEHWYVLATGPYTTREDAEADRYKLQFLLNINSMIITMPPKQKS